MLINRWNRHLHVHSEQAASQSEEELDPPLSDLEVEKPQKPRTGILKLNRTIEERIAKSSWHLHRQFDYWDVLKRPHLTNFRALSIQAIRTGWQMNDRFLTPL